MSISRGIGLEINLCDFAANVYRMSKFPEGHVVEIIKVWVFLAKVLDQHISMWIIINYHPAFRNMVTTRIVSE